MRQLDLFEKEKEPLTLKQAIKNDPITIVVVSFSLFLFIISLF